MTARTQNRFRRAVAPVLLALTLALLATFATGVVPAGATVIHHKEASFNGSEAPGGPFGILLVSDAVDQSNGDVWVTESNDFGLGQGVVDKFDESGVYVGVQITGAATPQGSFEMGLSEFRVSPGVAVDNSAGANKGEVYVADTRHGVVDRFSSAGVFECQIAGAETEKEIKEKDPSAKECFATGSGLPGAMLPTGVAVDASGDVYLADDAHEAIDRFEPSGKYAGQIKDSHLSNEMSTIALDSEGNLYVVTHEPGNPPAVIKFDPAGAFASVLDANSAFAVGVDPKTGHVYVIEEQEAGHQIVEYEPSGALLSVIATPGSLIAGLAVDGATGKLYAAELISGAVSIFSADIVVPTVTTSAATSVTETSATLNGHLDPDGGGEVSECQFEYGTTTAYGTVVPCSPGAPYVSAADVSASIGELTRSTVYHFRLRAVNANGASESEDGTFTTAGPAVIDSESAHVTGTAVTLRAQINPFHFDTSCRAQYVDDASFQRSGYADATTLPCSPEDLGSGFGDQGASVAVKGLRIATTYHYRFLAENQAGLLGAADRTFTTFGANSVKFEVIDKEGLPFTQAAGHPYELKTSFKVNSFLDVGGVDGNVKDVLTELPAGLIGDPSATAKCTRTQVDRSECSAAAAVGVAAIDLEKEEDGFTQRVDIYNLVPPKGIAAELGATIHSGEANLFIDAKLRSGGDYGVTAESSNASGLSGVSEVFIHLWGVPADPSHDAERCRTQQGEPGSPCPANEPLKPFLRNPTSCGGPLTTTLALDSWQNPGDFAETSVGMPAITGCGEVKFTPSLEVHPTTGVADSPTGLHVDVHIPQNEDPEALAEADLKDTRVTLPQGVTVNPSAANGLAACSPAQIGLTSAPGATPVTFTPAAAGCPDAAKIGTVQVDTPLIDHPLPGAVYIATPYQNPFDSLLAVYIAVYDPQTGVVVKLAGHVEANPQTGQLTTTFSDSPQVPFEDFKLDFFGGARAALATPEGCGTFTTSSSLTSWSTTTPVSSSEPLSFSSGCVSGFAPSFTAGTTSTQAGAYSPFTLSFSRSDTDQEIAGLSVTLPPGLVGKIAGIPLCPDAALAAAAARSGAAELASPSCPAASRLGTVQAAAGAGPDPLSVSGSAYLTGPYKGAPYGLAVIVPALAGPFDLGTVVVRQALHIDPSTAQVSVVSDPFPSILDVRGQDGKLNGFPLRLRHVDVTIDRPSFTLNPTSCNPMTLTATLTSTAGLSAPVSSRFQAADCASLPFHPEFSASTSGKTSKVNGASLKVRIGFPSGGQANIHNVELTIPNVLPTRLTTLQKACTEAQFNSNPAGCPAASNIATVIAHTPLLPDPLVGPVYFVSHGGAAFPDTEMVLQGDNVKLVIVGHTDIKKGVTYSRFETVPDAPVTSFEFNAPEGPYSIFGANGNLCQTEVRIPTTITAQNGAVLTQSTLVEPEGCPNTLTILSHSIKKRTITLKVAVPGAGKLTAAGKGLSKATKTTGARGTVTITLKAKGSGKLNTKVKLTFTPKSGAKQSKTVTVSFKK